MQQPLPAFRHVAAISALALLLSVGLSSGCAPASSQEAANDSTAIAPKLTLADSLADHSLPYQDQHGKWIARKGDGFSLRQPENFEEAQNLEGGYIWVLQLPPVERRQWITLHEAPSDSPAKSLQELGDEALAAYAEKSGREMRRESLGQGANAYQSLDIAWHMRSAPGMPDVDTDMATRIAIWQAKGNVFTLRLTSENSIDPADAEVFDKVAMSMRVE